MTRAVRSFVLLGAFLCFALLLTTGLPSSAQIINLNARQGLNEAVLHTPDQAAFQLGEDGKTWELRGSVFMPGAPWLEVRELSLAEAGTLIYGNILVQNNTATDQMYTFGFALPTTFAAPNMIRGSIDTSIIGTDATIWALPNLPIYSAQIDGVTVRTLQDFPFSLSTSQSANSVSAQFGYDPSTIAVGSSMGILLNFRLSPGATAAIISDFQIVVPEPSSLGLLLLGGGLLAAWRRARA